MINSNECKPTASFLRLFQNDNTMYGFAIILLFVAARPAFANPAARKLEAVDLGSCTAGYVDCVNGETTTADGTTITCAAACGSDCCVGDNSCFAANAKICMDGSCSGTQACYGARQIEYIVNSCIGDNSCNDIETVGYIKDSCIGIYACAFAGGHDGKVGFILDSCVGVKACYGAGYGTKVSFIESSCNGYGACAGLAHYGNVGFLLDSCHGTSSCTYASNTGNMTESCRGFEACYELFYSGVSDATMNNLMKCCNSDYDCKQATQYTPLPVTCSAATLVRCS